MSEEASDPRNDSSTAGFLQALGIGTVVGVALLFVFCILRTRIPDIYLHRSLLNLWKDYNDFNGRRVTLTSPQPKNTFFGWLGPVLNTTDEEILDNIGLDAVVFLRFIRTCLIICVALSLFGASVLMPVYATADNSAASNSTVLANGTVVGNNTGAEGLRVISLSNVPEQDSRLWATVVGEYLVAVLVVYMMTIDYAYYARLRRKYRTSENPVNYSVVVYDIPEGERTETAVRSRFEKLVPGQVADVIIVRNPKAALKLEGKLDAAVVKREVAENIAEVKGKAPQTRPGPVGCLMMHKPKVDAAEYWSQEQERLANELHDQGTKAKETPSAIVLLANKRAASYLVQANSATSATEWNVVRAPEPNALHWNAFSMPGIQAEFRTILVAFFMLVFTLFWTIPAAAIVGLFNLQNLPFADDLKNWSPAVTGLLEGLLPPVIMAVLVSLIPTIFRTVVGLERIASVSFIEVKTRDYFYMFTLYGSFLVIVLGSSFFREYEKIIDDPGMIIDELAKEIPGSGVYFATFLLVRSLIPFPLLLSGVVRAVIRFIMLKLAKTERQKRRARSGGAVFQYFRHSGGAMLTLFLALTFSTISPLVVVCAVVYFGLAYITFRHNLLFATYSPWDGGGELFPGTFWGTMLGLILKQVVTIVIMGLKKAPAQAGVLAVPPVLTACLMFIVSKRFERISENGSLLDLSVSGSKLDELPTRYHSVYEQPAGKVMNFANLNGIAEIKDVYTEIEAPSADDDAVHSETVDDNVGYVPDATAQRPKV